MVDLCSKYTRALTLRIVSHTCMYPPPHMTCMSCEEEDTCMRIVSHTHTHTHTYKGVIYIYTCVCVCVCVCIGVPPTGRFAPEESTVFVAARKVFCFSFFFLVALQERTVLVAASKDFYRPFSNIIYNIMYNIIHNIMYVLCFTNIIYMI